MHRNVLPVNMVSCGSRFVDPQGERGSSQCYFHEEEEEEEEKEEEEEEEEEVEEEEEEEEGE